ncbi:L,D-transpeptidase [Paraflavisolibacter sp. H34]|uniref:L,D-transpeptidase family protein n=1 Tax=Huijunlia imazamoxiresistens TaxID=3127457 RepID=UPI0030196423
MKSAIFLSTLLSGIGLLSLPSMHTAETTHLSAYKVSAAKRTAAGPAAPIRIIIDKSDYELSVYDAQGWYATYPVVFGNNTLADKKMEGDKNTPEGTFKIIAKRPHNKWDRYLALNYPTPECIQKFNARKQRGEVPPNARPGSAIGIHGTFLHEDFVVDRYKNWTDGCISLKRSDVEEIYSYAPVGTQVIIRR